MYDLHTHTTFSDGCTSPAENAALAAAAGLTGIALTDHDTTAGWAEMRAACAVHRLDFVPGIELSAEEDGHSVHLLGFWVDDSDPALAAECRRLSDERLGRAKAMVQRLRTLGVGIDIEDVLLRAGDAPVTRPHVAEALVDRGAVPDVPTAFERYLADGGPAHVAKHALAPEAAVALICAAGGAAVLAHPAVGERSGGVIDEALLDRIVAAGLCGVEADHPGHDEVGVARWRELARARGLLVTGSSDFHGRYDDEEIGRRTTPHEVVARLAERARRPTSASEGT